MNIVLLSVVVAVLLVGLTGCGKSEARRIAEQQAAERQVARQKLRETIAGIKVITTGATYSEFREKRMAFETCYEVNKPLLSDLAAQIDLLTETLNACDYCWQRASVRVSLYNNNTHFLSPKIPAARQALLTINPAVTNKFKLNFEQQYSDNDFDAEYNVKRALALIDGQCNQLLISGKQN